MVLVNLARANTDSSANLHVVLSHVSRYPASHRRIPPVKMIYSNKEFSQLLIGGSRLVPDGYKEKEEQQCVSLWDLRDQGPREL
jgi:hypothetical protein